MPIDKLAFRLKCLTGVALALCFLFTASFTQTVRKDEGQRPAPGDGNQSSPAFAEILLRKTELQADVESLLSEYTEDYPKVKETQYQLTQLQKEMDRVLAVRAADSSKLTLALGKLIVRKCELETELWSLLNQYKEGHPDVKRAKRKVDVFEQAIKQILG